MNKYLKKDSWTLEVPRKNYNFSSGIHIRCTIHQVYCIKRLIDHCLSFCLYSFWHCIVCLSLIIERKLNGDGKQFQQSQQNEQSPFTASDYPLWYLQTFLKVAHVFVIDSSMAFIGLLVLS